MEGRSLYFTGPREIAIRETNVIPGDDEVRVDTAVSAVSSGTELLLYRDEAPEHLQADATIDSLQGDLSYPVRYGYAAVGTVSEVGTDVSQDWLGRTVFAFNPHESRFAAEPEALIPVPEDLVPESMALFPSVETASSLVIDGHPRIGERVVVFGAGIVGLCTLAILSEFPLERLVAVEPIPERREHAERVGADVAVAPEDVDDLDLAGDGRTGADLVYELSGNPVALDDAVDIAGYDTRIIVGSWYGTKRAELDLGSEFHRDRVSIESSQVSTLAPETRGRFTRKRRRSVALDRLRDVDTDRLITDRIPFEDAAEAYRQLDERPDETLQVLLTYE